MAEVPGAPHAVPAGPVRVPGEAVPVAAGAGAGEAAEQVDAACVLSAVVQVRLGALVQVGHAGDRVQRAVHVQRAVADVARTGLAGGGAGKKASTVYKLCCIAYLGFHCIT